MRTLDGTYAIGALQIQTKDENLVYWSSDGSGTAKMYYAMGGYDEVDLAFSYMPPNPIDAMAKRIDHLQSLPYRAVTAGGRATDTLKTPGALPDMTQCKKRGNKVSAGPDIRFHDIAYRARDDLLYLHMLVKAITRPPQTSTRNAKDAPYQSTRFETEKV